MYIVKDIIFNLIIAIAITIFIKMFKYFKPLSLRGKNFIITGFWINFVISTGVSIVNEVEYALSSEFNFNEDITKYLRYFCYDFKPLITILTIFGIALILFSAISKYIEIKGSVENLPEDEIVEFSGSSPNSIKTQNICKKVFKYLAIAIVILSLFKILECIIEVTNMLVGFDFFYGDVSDIYYTLNNIPYRITSTLYNLLPLYVITSLISIFAKNEIKITNKKIFGFGYFCKKICVEFDNIVGVENKDTNGIIVNTDYNRIPLPYFENRDEVVAYIKSNIKIRPEKPILIEKSEDTMIEINPLLKFSYRQLLTVVILNFITFGIYQYVWIYKMTNALNLVDAKNQRDATNKVLLCLFIPMYTIWWFYKSALSMKKFENALNINTDIGILCPIFALLSPLFAMLMLQDNLNKIVK